MTLVLSILLTLGLQRPVVVYGCCPLANALAQRVVPTLVILQPNQESA